MIYDITRPATADTPVWPGDEGFSLGWTARIEEGQPANVSFVRFGTHTATHADAPYHVLPDGARIDEVPLDRFIGRTLVVATNDRETIDRRFVASVLELNPSTQRVLFRTGAWHAPDRFPDRFPSLEPAAADLLVAGGVVLVGTDAPSVDPLASVDLPCHHRLLGAGVVILENLLLDDVPEGVHQLIALPLRLIGADAAPVRAVLEAL